MADKFGMLVKLMMLTTSDNDNEALVALRKANAIIAGTGMNWEAFLHMKVKWPEARGAEPPPEYPSRTHSTRWPRSAEIDRMFEVLDENVKGSFREFVEDVYSFYTRTNFLTTAQYQAIKRAYDNHR
jgi:hypothetical protein